MPDPQWLTARAGLTLVLLALTLGCASARPTIEPAAEPTPKVVPRGIPLDTTGELLVAEVHA